VKCTDSCERILLAEDDPSSQMVATAMLKRLGYDADVANNGLEVLRALRRQKYVLVLMDIVMPRMEGIATTKEDSQAFSSVRATQDHCLHGICPS